MGLCWSRSFSPEDEPFDDFTAFLLFQPFTPEVKYDNFISSISKKILIFPVFIAKRFAFNKSIFLPLQTLHWGYKGWDIPSKTVISSKSICIIFAHPFHTVTHSVSTVLCSGHSAATFLHAAALYFHLCCLRGRNSTMVSVFWICCRFSQKHKIKKDSGEKIPERAMKTEGTFLYPSIWTVRRRRRSEPPVSWLDIQFPENGHQSPSTTTAW